MSEHDYRNPARGWGHDISWRPLPGHKLDASGWGAGIRQGDYLLLSNPAGGETRYQVEEIRYATDPKDQWFATLAFAPRPPMGDGE